jgi:hypothetical protein
MKAPWIFILYASFLNAQEQMHLTVATLNGLRPITLSADSIERIGPYPSTVQLAGNVRIKSPVCLPVGKNRKAVCDGYTILKADEATFNEASGEVEARGTVIVTPLL